MASDTFNEIALKTIQSQYAASPAIVALVESFAEQLDPDADIELFYQNYFNPYTAVGVGLDCWGRIVGADRKIYVDDYDFFGFYGQELQPFNQEPFYQTDTGEGSTDLTDEAYRWLILYKAMANISDSSVATSNALLLRLMSIMRSDAECYVLETEAMKVSVVFLFELSTLERAIFEKYGLLNVSAGTTVSIVEEIPPIIVYPAEGAISNACADATEAGTETVYGIVSADASLYYVYPEPAPFGEGDYRALFLSENISNPMGIGGRIHTTDVSITRINDIEITWCNDDVVCMPDLMCSQELSQDEYNALRNASEWIITTDE